MNNEQRISLTFRNRVEWRRVKIEFHRYWDFGRFRYSYSSGFSHSWQIGPVEILFRRKHV